MLLTIAAVLAAIWLTGLVMSYRMGGLIHILILLAIILSMIAMIH
jgi:hypothetical protein